MPALCCHSWRTISFKSCKCLPVKAAAALRERRHLAAHPHLWTTGYRFGAAPYHPRVLRLGQTLPVTTLACSHSRQRQSTASCRDRSCHGHTAGDGTLVPTNPTHVSGACCGCAFTQQCSREDNDHVSRAARTSCRQRISTPEPLGGRSDPAAFPWLLAALLHL